MLAAKEKKECNQHKFRVFTHSKQMSNRKESRRELLQRSYYRLP